METQQPTPPASGEQATDLPDPAELKFTAPNDVVCADDPRAVALAEWIEHARTAGHVIAEHLRPGSLLLDLPLVRPDGDRLHCGTARIGGDVLDVYLRTTSNEVYALRPGEQTRRALLGLDQAPADPAGWVSRTAARLVELVDRAQQVKTENDVDREAVQDLADMLGIVAALLPAWADRGVHPDTEYRVDERADQLTYLLDQLGA